MRDHLTFLLAAPMASFGGFAGHERRGSGTFPLRSAMLGLLGAALGVRREDAAGQKALRTYRVAIQPFQLSTPLRDFQVAETVPTTRAKRPNTRLQALREAGAGTSTVLTSRDYRCDTLIGVAIWGEGQWSLSEISQHLRRPKFVLYLGRKCCPLSSPLAPRVLPSSGPEEALAGVEIPKWLRDDDPHRQDRSRFPVFSDPVEGRNPPTRTTTMPAEPLDRKAWHFGESEIWRLRGGEDQQGSVE